MELTEQEGEKEPDVRNLRGSYRSMRAPSDFTFFLPLGSKNAFKLSISDELTFHRPGDTIAWRNAQVKARNSMQVVERLGDRQLALGSTRDLP